MEPIRLSLRTPFPVRAVNCWLLPGSPLTLVDPGPRSPETLADLEAGLAAAGHELADVELLLLTHQHVDHAGGAADVVERSGCRVAAHALLAEFLADYEGSLAAEDDFRSELLRRHGAPEGVVTGRRRVSSSLRFGSGVRVDRPLADGDLVEAGGAELRVVHRPGHSPTDTLFVDEAARHALVGDHLIASFSSSPVLHRTLDGASATGLAAYRAALRRTAELDLDRLHPGHGGSFGDHRRLVAERLELQERRAEAVLAVLGDRPQSAFELAGAVWGALAARHAYATLCGALGALELLVEAGRVRELERESRVVFAAAASG